MTWNDHHLRAFLITEAFRFIDRIIPIRGVRRIALVGSITTPKANPQDVDLLVTVDDEADLTALAKAARQLQGTVQSKNKGADIFLANPSGQYIGRTCRWSQCGPGIRKSCDALHCGRRHYLHDDLDAIELPPRLISQPPLEIWPTVVHRKPVPRDILPFLSKFKKGGIEP
jgi:predicted nucleotidyltransferase